MMRCRRVVDAEMAVVVVVVVGPGVVVLFTQHHIGSS